MIKLQTPMNYQIIMEVLIFLSDILIHMRKRYFLAILYQSHHSAGLNIVECCEATVNPLILLAVLAGVAALTILLRQLGKNNHIH